jgi:uncharacterized protein with ParB-like and HNH nuclease domain
LSNNQNSAGSEKFHETRLASLEQIFTEDVITSIPYYQRNYTWQSAKTDDRPVAKLFGDFIKKYNDWIDYSSLSEAEYMLGTLVYVKQKSRVHNRTNFQIVDGQQRTSTITMLLCIVRDIIIENNYDKITSDMRTWKESNLEYFIKLVEVAEENPIVNNSSHTQKHIEWKLKMNRVDAETFKKYIQFYRKSDFSKFVDEGKDFIKISKKIEWLNEQLVSKTPEIELKDSQRLIISAYCYLYKQVQDYLIVSFLNSKEAKDTLNELEEKALHNAMEKIKNKPKDFELDDDFFTNDVNGYDVLSIGQWSATEHENEFDKLYETYKKTKTGKNKTKQEYIKHLLSTKEKKLKKIRNTEKENQHSILNSQKRNFNLPTLIQFIKLIVMGKMFVTRNEVNDERDAIQIFDTMNSAGTELTKSNLIKNLIVKNVPESEQSDIASKWDDDIIEQVGEKMGDQFILQSLRSRGLKSKTQQEIYDFDKFHVPEHDKTTTPNGKNLYSIIQWKIEHDLDPALEPEVSRASNAKRFVDELVDDAKIYTYLINSEDETNPANPRNSLLHTMTDMNFLKYTYIRLPMYTAYREWAKTSNEFILLLKFLVPFFFKYKTMSDKNATKLEGYMITACEMIKNGKENEKEKTLYNIIKYLLSTYPDAEFENDLSVVGKDDTICKYVLHKINSYLTDNFSDVKPIDGLHLEHILPKSPKVNGNGELWNKDDFFTGYKTKNWPHYPEKLKSNWHKMLGNLTLLHYKTNTTIGNSNFKAKLSWKNKENIGVGFEKSELPLNKKTVLVCSRCKKVKREWWRAESIIERTETLNDYALKVWKSPGIFCSDTNCFGHTNPVQLFGDLDQVLSAVCEQTCDKDGIEFTDKNQCGEALIVKWYDTIPEYDVPTAYVHKEDSDDSTTP